MPYFSISSLHCLCVAKQAIAHILISTPVWNCFPRMSHTPWLGVATVRFCGNKSNRYSSDRKRERLCYFQFQHNKNKSTIQTDSCIAQCNWTDYNSQCVWEITLQNRNKRNSKNLTRPPYCNIGAGSTRPVTWAISSRTLNWNSWTNGSAS